MLENQFIQFTSEIDPLKREIALPIVSGKEHKIFLAENSSIDSQFRVDIVTPNGDVIVEEYASTYGLQIAINDLSALAPNECFRLKKTYETNKGDIEVEYSNLLRKADDDEQLSMLKYKCYEDALGFPFAGGAYVSQSLPILLSKPQFNQEDKIYTKRDGEQVVLHSSITKEYEGETDYIPMEWHEKILIALTCDEVYIDDERVTKSDNYEIDQENYTFSDNGIRLTKATFKAKTNITQRNSNY